MQDLDGSFQYCTTQDILRFLQTSEGWYDLIIAPQTLIDERPTHRSNASVLLRLSNMVKRIERLETLLSESNPNLERPSFDGQNQAADEQLTKQLSTLIVNDPGDSHYWGSSSAFSLFSPQGLTWIYDKTGSNDLQGLLRTLSSAHVPQFVNLCKSEVTPESICQQDQPDGYFHGFNRFVPLLDRARFEEYRHLQRSVDHDGQPQEVAWFAMINVVKAIGAKIPIQTESYRASSSVRNSSSDTDEKVFWDALRNACRVYIELAFGSHSLLTIQALVGLSICLDSTTDPLSAYMVLASAIRIAFAIGLHKQPFITSDSAALLAEAEQRHRVFWIMYALEKDLSLRLGRPPMINDDDIDVPLPASIQPSNNAQTASDTPDRHHFFYKLTMLSKIESRIYSELYSSKAESQPASERLKSIVRLNQAIKDWRLKLLPDVRPGDVLTCLPDERAAIAMLHLVYHNCILAIHRSPLHSALWTAKANPIQSALSQDPEVREVVESSQHLCVNSARWSLSLMKQLNQRREGHGRIFTNMYFAFNAITTLFANIIQDPRQETVQADRTLMRTTVDLLHSPQQNSEPDIVSAFGHLYGIMDGMICRSVERVSSQDAAVERSSPSGTGAGTDHTQQTSINSATYTNDPQATNEFWDMDIPDFTLSAIPEFNMADFNYQYPPSDDAYTGSDQFMLRNDGLYPWPFTELDEPHANPGRF
ncbi:hypothetical protein KCU91_g5441, partial [Aureobasidium melanogenum]